MKEVSKRVEKKTAVNSAMRGHIRNGIFRHSLFFIMNRFQTLNVLYVTSRNVKKRVNCYALIISSSHHLIIEELMCPLKQHTFQRMK